MLGPFGRARPPHDPYLEEDTMIPDIPDIMRPRSESTVCRICLDTERRMERISEELEEAYREVVGIKWDRAEQLPQHACWECAARLRGAAGLRRRALVSHHLLCDMRAQHNSLTLSDIKLIDRSYHQLTSNLNQEHFLPNEYKTRTINNNQLFATDNEITKYTELTLDTIKTIEKRNFADIVNNLLINNTDISIKEIKSTPVNLDGNYRHGSIVSDAIRVQNQMINCRSEQSFNNNLVAHKETNAEENLIVQNDFQNQMINSRSEQSFNNNLITYKPQTDENAIVRKDFQNQIINDRSEQSFNNNLAPHKHAVRKDLAVNTDVDDDSSSDCLVIDAGDEPMETVIRSEYVNSTDGGMPIDELIDIYNNNGDGDEILQELNQQFEGVAAKADQGMMSPESLKNMFTLNDDLGRWGSDGAVAATTKPKVTKTQTRKSKVRRRSRARQRTEVDRAEYCLKKTYEKLDRALFNITLVTDDEQIAEVLKRQETYRFKRAPFKCGLCFRAFSTRRAHAAHMLRHDESNGAYECVICKARQKSPRAIKTHMYGLHTVRISCKRCSFLTMNRSVARSHGKWHAGTIYRCPYCPGQFDQESTFKYHLRTQHVHAHVCAFCGLTFVSAKGLAVHRCKRHADADKIPIEGPYCEVCEVRFATEEAYTRHLKMSSRHQSDNMPRHVRLQEADGY